MSCEFNSIEKVWHATKTYYNKRLMSAAGEVNELRFRQLVLESLTQMPEAAVLRLCRSNRRYIAKIMRQAD